MMIKVIRQAHRREFTRFTCKNCHSVLEADIKSIQHEEHYPDTEDFITCPVCAHHIAVTINDWPWEIAEYGWKPEDWH